MPDLDNKGNTGPTDVDELRICFSHLAMCASNLGAIAATDKEADPELGAAVSRIGSAMRHLAQSLDLRCLEIPEGDLDRGMKRLAREADEQLAHVAAKRLYDALKKAHVLTPAETMAAMEEVLSAALEERRERNGGGADAN